MLARYVINFCLGAWLLFYPTRLVAGILLPPATDDGLPIADTRLDSFVSREGTGITIAQLLNNLSTRQLRLEADSNCSGLKIQLRVKNVSLRTLLHDLAVLVPANWEPLPKGTGYRLVEKGSFISYAKRWWEIYFDARKQAENTIRLALLHSVEGNSLQVESSPKAPSSKFLFSADDARAFMEALPLPLKTRIVNTFSLDEQPAFFSVGVPGVLFDIMLGGVDSEPNAIVIALNELPEDAQRIVQKHQSQNGLSLPLDEVVIFHVGEGFINASLYSPDVPGATGNLQVNVQMPQEVDLSAYPDHLYLPDLVKQLGGAAPADLKELARYQESRFWPNPKPSDPTALRPLPFNRADVLNWLGQRADIEFISDYYDKGGIPFHPQAPVKQPIDDSINDIAWGLDFSWKKEGDIYLFRNNRWYRDDRLQVPDALAQQLLAQQKDLLPPDANDPKATVEWLGRVGQLLADLSPWQIANGFRWLTKERLSANINTDPVHPLANFSLQTMLNRYPFCQLADVVLGERFLAQFVAALTPEQKQQLVQGVLPFDSLSPALRQVATYLSPGVTAAVILKQQPLLLGIAHRPFGAGYTLAASVGIAIR